MGRIGFSELVLILLVILVLFGAKRLPEIGSSLGKAIREFQKALKGDNSPDDKEKERHDEIVEVKVSPVVIEIHLDAIEKSDAGGFGERHKHFAASDDP